MLRTPQQNARLHGLINELNIDADTKATLVHSHTDGRTSSSREMMNWECQNLIKFLEKQEKPKNDSADKMRKKIISICYEMGWTFDTGRINMERINNFCIKFGYLHKPLNDYSINELPELVTQFKKVLNSSYK